MAVTDFGANGIEIIGESAPSGCVMGLKTTSKIGFYGTTPAVQQLVGSIATTAPTSTSPYGFTSAQATSILNAVIALQTLGVVGSV